jgi:hypothetical protein
MEEFLIRVITEQNELYDKLTKLNKFIESDKFKAIDDENQRLLKMQSSAMSIYNDVLNMRYELLTRK